MIVQSVVVPDDYAALARFLASFPDDANGEEFWSDRFRLWWEDNPAFAEGIPRGWMLKDADGRPIGFLANVARLFRSDRTDRRVFCAATWRVLPEHRNTSTRLYAAHIAAGAGTVLFNTTPNAAVVQVLERLRFQSVASSRSGRAYFLPINPSAVARAYVRRAGRPSAFAPAMAAGLAIAHVPSRVLLMTGGRGDVRPLIAADDALDALWTNTRDIVSNTSVRSSDQVHWMCFSSTIHRKTVLGSFDRGSLQAYAIFRDAPWSDLRVLELFDLWPPALTPSVLSTLLAGSFDYARMRGYDLLLLHDYSDALTQVFRRMRVFFGTTDDSRYYYIVRGANQAPLLPENSYLTALEGDIGL